jgi:hypothetical protein
MEQELHTKDMQELSEEILRLERELKRARESRNFFFAQYEKVSRNLHFFKESVKSVILYIDRDQLNTTLNSK